MHAAQSGSKVALPSWYNYTLGNAGNAGNAVRLSLDPEALEVH